MSKRVVIASIFIFILFCIIRIIQFLDLVRYPNFNFGTEYVIRQILIFVYRYLPIILLLFSIIFLVTTIRKEKIFALVPLIVFLLSFTFFSNFSFFEVYVSNKLTINYLQYKQVTELVKQNKLQLVDKYPIPPSTYWNEYEKYGNITNYIYKLPNKYKHLSKDYSNRSNILVLQSEKLGLIQVKFYINGSRFTYIYVPDEKIFSGSSTIIYTEKKKEHWYYVVWK